MQSLSEAVSALTDNTVHPTPQVFTKVGTDTSMLDVALHKVDCVKTGTTNDNRWTSFLLVSERAYGLHAVRSIAEAARCDF